MSLINSNFVLNLYNDLLNEHSGSDTSLKAIPYYLGPPGFNLRSRNIPLSCSIGKQSGLDSSFDYSRTQRKLNDDIEDQEQSGSL